MIFAVTCACRTADVPSPPEITPRRVTTAGGTRVTVEHLPFTLREPTVELGLPGRVPGASVEWLPAEGVVVVDKHTLQFKSPQFIEACADVRLRDGEREEIMEKALCFRTLAFTANQAAGTISIVDTRDNELFGPRSSMDLGAAAAPIALAYNQCYPPGQALYALDAVTGDLVCLDAANFVPLDIDAGMAGVQDRLVLQDPQALPASRAAFDLALALAPDGEQGFVTHVTAGLGDDPTNPTPGGLSWFTINWEAEHAPVLKDVDGNAQTTSPGAPEGVTRARLCVGDPPDCAAGNNAYFYPLSIKIVNLATDAGHTFEEGEPYPGEYAFVSGVGHTEGSAGRPAMAAVLDLNAFLYCDPSRHPRDPSYCLQNWESYYNPRYFEAVQYTEGYANYKTLEAGTDNSANLGDTKHPMDFAADSGTPSMGPTLYLANQDEGAMYLFNYDDVNWDWVRVESGDPPTPVTLATGTGPSGVKVQTVGDYTYAYIANADDDTVYTVAAASNSTVGYYDQTDCNDSITHAPIAIDTRSTGERGYSADTTSSTVSVFDLVIGEMNDPICEIALPNGSDPGDLVVQPVPNETEFFEQMMGMMVFSTSTDYDAPEAQAEMIGDWKAIRRLELTPASPQAIKAALSAYLNKIDQKVCKEKLNKHMKQAVKLYRAAYLHHHPGN